MLAWNKGRWAWCAVQPSASTDSTSLWTLRQLTDAAADAVPSLQNRYFLTTGCVQLLVYFQENLFQFGSMSTLNWLSVRFSLHVKMIDWLKPYDSHIHYILSQYAQWMFFAVVAAQGLSMPTILMFLHTVFSNLFCAVPAWRECLSVDLFCNIRLMCYFGI